MRDRNSMETTKEFKQKNNSIVANHSHQVLIRPHNATAIVEKSRKIIGASDDFLSSALTQVRRIDTALQKGRKQRP